MARKKRPRTNFSDDDLSLLETMETGISYEEAATQLGQDKEYLRRRVLKILDRVSKEELLERFPVIYMSAHGTEGMSLESDVLQQAKELGMSKSMIDSVKRRVRARQGMSASEGVVLSDAELIDVLKSKLSLSLQYYDPFSLAAASSKDIMANVDTLVKNIQLLTGKPTSITSNDDRLKLNELMMQLISEAKRRGITIDGEATVVEPIAVEVKQ